MLPFKSSTHTHTHTHTHTYREHNRVNKQIVYVTILIWFYPFTYFSTGMFQCTRRLRLLAAVAKQQGVTKVLLGNCATRLSVHLLSSISQGQGAHLPYDIVSSDNFFLFLIFCDITIIKLVMELFSILFCSFLKMWKLWK